MKQLYVALKGFVLASLLCLILTANASGSWVTTTVDPGNVRGPTSIALDSSDKAHVSYCDTMTLNAFDLKYATNALGSWETTKVDSDGFVGEFNSIALDSLDRAHISYYDQIKLDLKYTTDSGGGICAGATVASTPCSSPVYGPLGLAKHLAYLLLPVGAVIFLGILRRKR